jgi:hypothetical protein
MVMAAFSPAHALDHCARSAADDGLCRYRNRRVQSEQYSSTRAAMRSGAQCRLGKGGFLRLFQDCGAVKGTAKNI